MNHRIGDQRPLVGQLDPLISGLETEAAIRSRREQNRSALGAPDAHYSLVVAHLFVKTPVLLPVRVMEQQVKLAGDLCNGLPSPRSFIYLFHHLLPLMTRGQTT